PDLYADQVQRIVQGLRDAGFNDEQTHADQIAQRREAPFWEQFDLSEGLRAKLIERVAPLYLAAGEPRTVHLDGTASPPYPLTDVTALQELPTTVLDVTSMLGDVDRLILTHTAGRLLPSLKTALEGRGGGRNPAQVKHQATLGPRVRAHNNRSTA